MFRRSLLQCGVATTATTSSNSVADKVSGNSPGDLPKEMSAETRRSLHAFYRKLLEAGEDGPMMQHTLSVHTLSESLSFGKKLLSHHTALLAVRTAQMQTSAYRHPLKRMRLAMLRRKHAWSIFWLRLRLRSKNALSDALVYTLFIVTCVLLYEIYRACRVGVNRAEERYRTMAIPIIQTFDALEAMEERKRILKKEMEDDIKRERGQA